MLVASSSPVKFWKTWKVLEFYSGILQDWKVLEKATDSGQFWKSVKLNYKDMKCMEGVKEN